MFQSYAQVTHSLITSQDQLRIQSGIIYGGLYQSVPIHKEAVVILDQLQQYLYTCILDKLKILLWIKIPQYIFTKPYLNVLICFSLCQNHVMQCQSESSCSSRISTYHSVAILTFPYRTVQCTRPYLYCSTLCIQEYIRHDTYPSILNRVISVLAVLILYQTEQYGNNPFVANQPII